MKGKRILCVGLVCIDLKTIVNSYPAEDSGQRTLDTLMERGGNASNTATVLSSLGAEVEFLGTIADCENNSFLRSDFEDYNVNVENIVVCAGTKCPLSVVIINSQNGSRTILHSNKSLRELSVKDFQKVNLQNYKWIHFEGRPNKDQIGLMIHHIRKYNQSAKLEDRIVISLEIEKLRPKPLDDLIDLADYTFLSKDYASHLGYSNMTDCVAGVSRKGKTIICAWGECGAAATTFSGPVLTSPIYEPDQLVDTTAAGDTFIAGCLFTLDKGYHLQTAIDIGCRVAGAKCGMMGLRGIQSLKKHVVDLLSNSTDVKCDVRGNTRV